ncbi:MAG: 4,5-dihydroxyphthalate decarboxylase [Rhodospirillales bacterium CG15_BIG_FIL_POST_REV_8_21_14_020_66_15]|nr:MAG: 4,5-dihydroxyphthalate decarboxylase [Rhodospirillales bacterium CG15_BIG_FIL_POST_REV_8_21_14_020_66_15]
MTDTPLDLTLACWDYDRAAAVLDGRAPVAGCRVTAEVHPTSTLFPLAVGEARFDVTEMSMSSYILQVAKGEGAYVAIPVFLSRAFRHNGFVVRADAGIDTPKDLEGRKVGVPEYQMTAALWMRGILADEYGVDTDTFQWRTGALEEGTRKDRLTLDLPPHLSVTPIAAGESLQDLLLAGELDAVFAPKPLNALVAGDPRVRRLFPDFAAAERAYHVRTGFFPIMHAIGLRRTLAEAHPWLPKALFDAFTAARDMAMEKLEAIWLGSANRLTLPFFHADMEATRALMGADFWSYGFAANRAELDAMCRWSQAQHLAPRQVRPEELFPPSLL